MVIAGCNTVNVYDDRKCLNAKYWKLGFSTGH